MKLSIKKTILGGYNANETEMYIKKFSEVLDQEKTESQRLRSELESKIREYGDQISQKEEAIINLKKYIGSLEEEIQSHQASEEKFELIKDLAQDILEIISSELVKTENESDAATSQSKEEQLAECERMEVIETDAAKPTPVITLLDKERQRIKREAIENNSLLYEDTGNSDVSVKKQKNKANVKELLSKYSQLK
ncbi:MAG: hypothetical protein K0R90_1471 [Oscillospiraceae bacterium]|nr:hypothetical protein [Oscillospiraceae bacterium]